jgi:hypothetical protein
MRLVSGDNWKSVFAKNTLLQRGNGSAQTVLSEWHTLERREDDKGLVHASDILEFEERLSVNRATFQYTDGLLVFSSGGVCSFGGLWKTSNESPEVISMPSATLAYAPQAFAIRHPLPSMLMLGAAMGFSNVRVNIPAQAPVAVSDRVSLAQYARSIRLMSVLSKFTGANLKSDVSDYRRIQLRDPASQYYGLVCEACGVCTKCALTSLENQLRNQPSVLKKAEVGENLKTAWYEYMDSGSWLQLDGEDIDYPYITWLYESAARFRSLVD